ncbi:hypothetical protein psyc5s11_28630 [Clostridium gelidum]|uniref:TIR domain-containing protein n=1 Tax=Clostridium gelidum TaxID=704125 RepID=A0ABM7TCF9_9CLOT|nr:toll/interleukin-1 receptor domain-containing protein [Clostridium gelidum]BCZ46796.1 hypothetical protein psyc5s11_28630 [Clostridium gelidum]
MMKNDLLSLINKIDDLKMNFHISSGTGVNIIYDTFTFADWKQEVQLELQDIYDQTKDNFIWDTLIKLKQGFNDWKDERTFNEVSGSLNAIKKNIDKYYPVEITEIKKIKGEITMLQKSHKIFISHSSSDKEYVSKLIDLLEGIGLNHELIFCSSVPGYGIPLDNDIYDYLKIQFETYNLHVILVLSDNYYKSVACMNEMGAAWILKNRYTTILLPGFEFTEVAGAINPRQIGLKLDNEVTEVKEKLGQLKDCLLNEFGLSTIPDIRWEQKRDLFINSITTNKKENTVSNDVKVNLRKTIKKSEDLDDIHSIQNKTDADLSIILGDSQIEADSVKSFYRKIFEHLIIKQIDFDSIVPFKTGNKRYLINKENKHISGYKFFSPIQIQNYYIETHKSKNSARLDIIKFLNALSLEVR